MATTEKGIGDKMNNQQIYVLAMSVNTLVSAMGMMAENEQRRAGLSSPAYVEKDFQKLLENNGCTHNGILGALSNYAGDR
jgi:hypothetical protein